MTRITELKEKAQSLTERQEISHEQVEIAMRDRRLVPISLTEMFYLLSCLNLLNSAVKHRTFKKHIPYPTIKMNVSRILELLLDDKNRYLVDDFWINQEEQCAYIVCNSFQFTFHNVQIKEQLKFYAESSKNKIKPWEGVRLQFIASDLFMYAQMAHFNNSNNVNKSQKSN